MNSISSTRSPVSRLISTICPTPGKKYLFSSTPGSSGEKSFVTRQLLSQDTAGEDSLEFSAYLFDSKVNKQGNSNGQDWGASLEFKTENEAIIFGLGFLSDLAESDESFLADENNAFESRVSAWNAYALYGMDKFEITAEYVQANDRFREFDNNADKPSAYNIELSYLPTPTVQFALRYEQSDELSDQPEQQYGMTSTWRPGKRVTFAFDYLHGQYRDGFVLDDDDNPQNDRDLLAAQISLEF